MQRTQRENGSGFHPGQACRKHQPDAEVLLGEQRVALEGERSAKTPARLPAILYQLTRTYSGIWYFCPPPTQALIQRAIAELNPPAIRQKFTVVPLQPEGEPTRRPTVSPALPPPGSRD